MEYELAKELYEAGFRRVGYGNKREIDTTKWIQIIKETTLSELIEACGDNLYSLYNHISSWQAYSNSDPWDTDISEGNTPEEAVARLWLALNKK